MQARRKSRGLSTAICSSVNDLCVRNTNLSLDNGLSGEQRVRVECVLRIINDFIEKLEVSMVMPHVLATSKDLVEEDLKAAGLDLNALNTSKSKLRESLHPDDFVSQLQQFMEKCYRKTKPWTKWSIFRTNENEILLADFTLLYNITREKLSKSALADLSKEKKLLKLQQNIASLDESVAEYEKRLKKQKLAHLWKVGFRAALIHKYEEDLAYQKWDNNMRIQQEIVRSSKAIQNLQESSHARLAKLEYEAEKKRLIYNKLLQDDLLLEKEAKTEKKKLLFQLQTYIRKYDQNIGDKIKENLSLQEDYLSKKAKFEEFLLEYRNEEIKYFAIVEQKEREEQFLFEQKLMVFMMGRAARAIQVRWRRFRRDQKKKSKKKGKGKKK